MAVGCFVSAGRSLDAAVRRVRLAEELGYEACYVTHIAGRESLTLLTIYASSTERLRIGTGVVPIYTRTPATMAQTAATINEFSHGRLRLGLGISHRPVVEGWHGQSIDSPAGEMREYVEIVRAILRGEDPPAGTKWSTGFRLAGVDIAPDLPIYIAALSPLMLRLAGEIADGVLLWLCVPDYIRTVVVPEVTKGREKAGKGLDGLRHRARRARPPQPTTSGPPTRSCAATSSPTSRCRSTAPCSSARASARSWPSTTAPPATPTR